MPCWWRDPLHLARLDRYEGGEERWLALGSANGVVLLVVWYTSIDEQDDRIRIIGARKATHGERRAYEQGAGRPIGSVGCSAG